MQDHLIIGSLIANEQYCRKVLPYLKDEYFNSTADKAVFTQLREHFNNYNNLPSKAALLIDIAAEKKLNEEDFSSCEQLINTVDLSQSNELPWLVNMTEKFCKDKALYLALMESVAIVDGKSQKLPAAMPDILSAALAVSFDTHIGHDFLDDAEARHKFYHLKESKIPFDLAMFNEITKGGVSRKTLNIILAGTGVGKTLVMCHMAGFNLSQGLNVLYITNEMAEERIAERIDASLLNMTIQDLEECAPSTYLTRINALRKKTHGKLIIKEYPTATAGALQFKHLLSELKIKKNFIPDIIYIDYLNICISSRIKASANVNSYTYVKAIAEELRGLAVEYNVPVVSATQTTRSGFTNTDLELTDTSESFGLPATADFMFALISTEELDKLNQLLIKQLKNRYSDFRFNKRFVVGIDRSKMRLFDVDQSAQADLNDDPPVMDNTAYGKREQADRRGGPGNGRRPGNSQTFPN